VPTLKTLDAKSLSTLSQKSAAVAEFRRCLAVFGDSRTFLPQSHLSATVWTGLNVLHENVYKRASCSNKYSPDAHVHQFNVLTSKNLGAG